MQEEIKATKEHCKYCFEVLEAKLKKQQIPPYPSSLEDSKVPIFVTWMFDGELRGCIGTFSSTEKLSKILPRYTIISGLEDDRFDPIELSELSHLSVGVSFLVNFRPNQGAYDWQVGTHGIILDLKRQGRHYSATFLPEVAEEQNWDKSTTLKYLLEKAGCQLPLSLVQSEIKITTYESSKANLSFKEIDEKKQAQKEGNTKIEIKQ